MTALGFIIADDGSIEPSWEHAKRSVWRAWWVNLGSGKFKASIDRQIALLNRIAAPVLMFQAMIRPWSRSTERSIDSLQAFLVSRLRRLPGRDDEMRQTYWQRRNRASGDLARRLGTWSQIRSRRVVKWQQHLIRHPDCWVFRLLLTRGRQWPQQRRTEHLARTHTLTSGRTRTRAIRQRVQCRYEQGMFEWHQAHGTSEKPCRFVALQRSQRWSYHHIKKQSQ